MKITWSKNNIPVITLDNGTYFNFGSNDEIKWIVVGGKVNVSGFKTTSRSLIPVKITLSSIPNDIKKNIDKNEVKKISKVVKKYVNEKGCINKRHLKSIMEELQN
jgi:hypothetical protein